jgi:hypothetical protein
MVAVVHERARELAWGLSEVQGGCCSCWFGRRDREKGQASRCSTRFPVQCTVDDGGYGLPLGLAGGAGQSTGCMYPPGE